MTGDARDRRRPAGLGEFLFNELRQAIQDIRQKVVEQGWFGRVTTPKPVVEMPFSAIPDKATDNSDLMLQRSQSFEQFWATRETKGHSTSPEIEIER